MKRRKSQPPKHDPSANQQKEHREKEATNQHVYVEPGVQIDLIQDLKQEYRAANADASVQNKKQLFWARVSAGLIFIYAGLTLWQAVSTKNAANATTRAAKTAADNLFFAQQQFRMDQRPYLSADPRGGYKPPGQTEHSVIQIIPGAVRVGVVMEIQNRGKSPAMDVFATPTQYKIGPREEVENYVQNYVPEYPITAASTVITAGGRLNPYSPVETITRDQWDKVADGTWEFYVFGAVKYKDMFKPPIETYETTYCYQIAPRGLPFGDCQFKSPHFRNSIQ
jgi:hypothetical protein